jgi:RNA polymerase sigma-70 factor, ECF subfamily
VSGHGHVDGPVFVMEAEPQPVSAGVFAPAAERAFEAVYREHFGFVWRILRRLGVPTEALEDAAQEVFLVLHRRRAGLGPDVSLRSWLFGTARRVAADVRRGQHRRERRLQALAVVHGDRANELPAEQAEAAEFVQRFLERLDPDKRMVFVLADLEGMTAPEIAGAIDVKLNTVYSRLRAARAEFERSVADATAQP